MRDGPLPEAVGWRHGRGMGGGITNGGQDPMNRGDGDWGGRASLARDRDLWVTLGGTRAGKAPGPGTCQCACVSTPLSGPWRGKRAKRCKNPMHLSAGGRAAGPCAKTRMKSMHLLARGQAGGDGTGLLRASTCFEDAHGVKPRARDPRGRWDGAAECQAHSALRRDADVRQEPMNRGDGGSGGGARLVRDRPRGHAWGRKGGAWGRKVMTPHRPRLKHQASARIWPAAKGDAA